MPMFPPSGPQAAVPPIPMQLGLLPNPADPRTRPVGPLARMFGGGGAARGRDERPTYTPEQVIKSQQSIADWFQSRPPAAYNVPGYIGTAGNAFMGTFIPTRAEERLRENERIEADTARRAGSATTLDDAIAALSGGSPTQRNLATTQRLQGLDPARQAQTELVRAQIAAARDKAALEQQILGIAGLGPSQPAPPGQPPAQPPAAQMPPTAFQQFPMPPGAQAAPQAPPQQEEAILPPGSFTPLPQPAAQAQPPHAAVAPPTAPQAAAAPPAQPRSAREILMGRPEADRLAFVMAYKKDPAEAAKMLREWSDPQGAQASVVAREAAEAEGKALGLARSGLPSALRSGESITRNIDSVIGDTNRDNITGWQQMFPFGYLPYSPSGQDSHARIEQLQGQAFLQAFNDLRGGGQITEAEGRKASDALARLSNLGQSDAGYRVALDDARKEIHDLMNVARQKAGQQPVPYTPYQAPDQRQQSGTPDRRTLNGKNYIKQNGQWFEE